MRINAVRPTCFRGNANPIKESYMADIDKTFSQRPVNDNQVREFLRLTANPTATIDKDGMVHLPAFFSSSLNKDTFLNTKNNPQGAKSFVNDLMKRVVYIDDYADFTGSSATDLGNLKRVRGHLFLDSNIENANNLAEVGVLVLNNFRKPITSLHNINRICTGKQSKELLNPENFKKRFPNVDTDRGYLQTDLGAYPLQFVIDGRAEENYHNGIRLSKPRFIKTK